MNAPLRRQRHGGNRGAVNHRQIQATREFYNAGRDRQGTRPVVIPVEPTESRATRLPPYGREVAAAVASGQRVNVYVISGIAAWDRARKRHADKQPGNVMLLPPGEDPTAYRWPAVPNGVFLHSVGEPRQRVFDLARAIVSCGTPMVFAIFGDDESLIVRVAEWPEMRAAA